MNIVLVSAVFVSIASIAIQCGQREDREAVSINRLSLRPASLRPISDQNADSKKREPTFEETKNFILKRTRKVWEENPGDQHSFTLAFVKKRLRFQHRFTSTFSPGYVERFEVDLSDLDPSRIGAGETGYGSIVLEATNQERKVLREFTPARSIDDRPTERTQIARLLIPGAEVEEREKMEERLKKAWAHLIKLSGGKESDNEPF